MALYLIALDLKSLMLYRKGINSINTPTGPRVLEQNEAVSSDISTELQTSAGETHVLSLLLDGVWFSWLSLNHPALPSAFI